MRGELMMRTTPLASAALRRTLRLTFPPTLPRVRPSAPPEFVPTAAGRFTAKFGLGVVPAKGVRPWRGALLSVAPPATAQLYGKAIPVGLPFVLVIEPSPPH